MLFADTIWHVPHARAGGHWAYTMLQHRCQHHLHQGAQHGGDAPGLGAWQGPYALPDRRTGGVHGSSPRCPRVPTAGHHQARPGLAARQRQGVLQPLLAAAVPASRQGRVKPTVHFHSQRGHHQGLRER